MQTRYPHAFVLNVMAEDRPGIVSAVSRAVAGQGGNIDSCSQTVLAGYFTLIMLVSFPAETTIQRLAEAVAGPAGENRGFQVLVRPFEPEKVRPAVSEGENFVITAFGPDHEGILNPFASLLANKGININDLYVDNQADQFVLIGQVRVPPNWDLQMLQADLEELAREAGYTVRIQHENVFVATNQSVWPARAERPAKIAVWAREKGKSGAPSIHHFGCME